MPLPGNAGFDDLAPYILLNLSARVNRPPIPISLLSIFITSIEILSLYAPGACGSLESSALT